MRRHLEAAALVALGLGLGAGVGPASADRKLEAIDISAVRDKMVVLHDGNGHYVAILPRQSAKDRLQHFYYGDGKRFYAQRTYHTRLQNTDWARQFWAPQSGNGIIAVKDGKWKISCDRERKGWSPMAAVSAAETRRVLERGRFFPRYFQRSIVFLARDEAANYYLVDAERGPRTRAAEDLRDMRLYRGPAGTMKRLRSTRLASDVEGIVIVTRAGTLLINHGLTSSEPNRSTTASAIWKTKKTRSDLRLLNSGQNQTLIFSTLGTYGRLGTPCDDIAPQ